MGITGLRGHLEDEMEEKCNGNSQESTRGTLEIELVMGNTEPKLTILYNQAYSEGIRTPSQPQNL